MDERFQQLRSSLGRISADSLGRLARSLDRCEAGFDKDLRTPLFGGRAREEILEILERTIGHTGFMELEAIDTKERSKVGPISIMRPFKDRRDDVLKYSHQLWNADPGSFNIAVDEVKSLLPQGSLRLASFETAFDMMPKDTSLGLPWLTRDRAYVQDYFQRAVHLESPDDVYPCVLYWRGQAAGPNETKQRVVWGFDHAETIFGATVMYPVLNSLRRLPGFSAWQGNDAVDLAITNLLRSSQGRRIISMDYSGFDSSLHINMLNAVDSILAYWFMEPGPERVLLLGMLSNTVPIVVPVEILLEGRNGAIPSGSVLTGIRGTIANLIAGKYVGIRAKAPLRIYELLGDDSVFLFMEDIDSEEISSLVGELGLECNPEKLFVSRSAAHYLQRWHSLEYVKDGLCRGVRSPYRAMSGMLGYERWVTSGWSKYMDTARWIMQTENMKHDPRFRSCVGFLKEGDDILKSGMDPEVVFKKAGGADVVRSVLNIPSYPFNVQDPDKVAVFETTKVLRSLD